MKICRQLFFAAALFTSASACFAQEISPFFPVINDGILPTNAVISQAPISPGFPGQGPPSASPAPSVDFSGLSDLGTFVPPDTHGAVGASNVVTTLNTQVRIQTRTGTVVDTTSLSNFWSSVGPFSTVSDPRVIYDPFYKRWIATAIVEPFLATSSLVIGVSKSENPAFTNWFRYRFDADASNITFADQPAIGFNKDWIVAQANMISNSLPNGARGSRIWVFTKTNLYAGGNEIPRAATFTNILYSQIPAVTLDTNTATLYLVQDFRGHFTNAQQVVNGYLSIYTVTGAIGSESFSQTSSFPSAAPWARRHSKLTGTTSTPLPRRTRRPSRFAITIPAFPMSPCATVRSGVLIRSSFPTRVRRRAVQCSGGNSLRMVPCNSRVGLMIYRE